MHSIEPSITIKLGEHPDYRVDAPDFLTQLRLQRLAELVLDLVVHDYERELDEDRR